MSNVAPLLPRLVRSLAVAALTALVWISCTNQPAAVRCAPCTTSAIVAGTVRDTLGAPVTMALVSAAAYVDSCTGASADVSTDNILGSTDSSGRYALRLRSSRAPFAGCVSVEAVLSTDTLVRTESVLVGRLVQFRPDFPAGGPHDSIGIDVVLRHPPEAVFQFRACKGSLNVPPDGDVFRVLLRDSTQIQVAAALLATGSTHLVFGSLRSGDGGFNASWSWHLDPASVSFPGFVEAAYVGCPSFVESNLSSWLSRGRFATGGQVIARDR